VNARNIPWIGGEDEFGGEGVPLEMDFDPTLRTMMLAMLNKKNNAGGFGKSNSVVDDEHRVTDLQNVALFFPFQRRRAETGE